MDQTIWLVWICSPKNKISQRNTLPLSVKDRN